MNLIGKIVEGKWNKNRYRVDSLIGKGGIGEVYKVFDLSSNRYYALKISNDLQSITQESHMLTTFNSVDSLPRIIDIDDYAVRNSISYFIVLEYIQGTNLREYMNNRSVNTKEALSIVLIIGETMKRLHDKGLILGDLKLENIMIDSINKRVKIIDLGGVTSMGNSLIEFTPLYDRARWKMGLRRADEGYDIFSVSMIIVAMILKDEQRIIEMSIDNILKEIKRMGISDLLIELIKKGLFQKVTKFNKYLDEIKAVYNSVDRRLEGNYYQSKVNTFINYYFLGCMICFFAILFIVITKR